MWKCLLYLWQQKAEAQKQLIYWIVYEYTNRVSIEVVVVMKWPRKKLQKKLILLRIRIKNTIT